MAPGGVATGRRSAGAEPTRCQLHQHSASKSLPQCLSFQPRMSAWRSEFYHVFSIAEIAIQIVELFDLDSNPDDVGAITNSRATLAALARVCTVTSAPALDYLWSILDHLGPLVRLLPREAYTDDRKEIKVSSDVVWSHTNEHALN